MEFAIMWANHDPVYVHPAQLRHGSAKLADGNFTEEFYKEVTDYIIDNYFCRKNYIRVDGKIYFPIWSMKKFIHSFGSVENAAKVITDFRERAAKKGYELHIAGHKRFAPYYGMTAQSSQPQREIRSSSTKLQRPSVLTVFSNFRRR